MPGNTDTNRPSFQKYVTPLEFVQAVEKRFDVTFALDLAGDASNKKAPFVITPEMNSLACDWNGSFKSAASLYSQKPNPTHVYAAWLNPPYDVVNPWAVKISTFHAGPLFALVPAAVCTRWFLDNLTGPRTAWLSVFPRLPFVGMDAGIDRDLMLVVHNYQDKSGWIGEFKHPCKPAKKVRVPKAELPQARGWADLENMSATDFDVK